MTKSEFYYTYISEEEILVAAELIALVTSYIMLMGEIPEEEVFYNFEDINCEEDHKIICLVLSENVTDVQNLMIVKEEKYGVRFLHRSLVRDILLKTNFRFLVSEEGLARVVGIYNSLFSIRDTDLLISKDMVSIETKVGSRSFWGMERGFYF